MADEVYVGLGSNLGDRLGNLQAAVSALGSCDGVEVLAVSPVYETDPVGPPQPDYLNAVLAARTRLGPAELLEVLKKAEDRLGRRPGARWGPRLIDLDLLLYADRQISSGRLVVPHPQLLSRSFVLIPLADLAPELEIPGAGRVLDAATRAGRDGVRALAAGKLRV